MSWVFNTPGTQVLMSFVKQLFVKLLNKTDLTTGNTLAGIGQAMSNKDPPFLYQHLKLG